MIWGVYDPFHDKQHHHDGDEFYEWENPGALLLSDVG